MELSSLRRWGVLIYLSDKQLEEIDYLIVYGSDRYCSQGLSALMITKTDRDVYATGYNSLVGSAIAPSYNYLRGFSVVPSYIIPGDRKYFEKRVKVKELCGLGLKKIVVGSNFGAGLTVDNELYVWGEGPEMVLRNAACVMFEHYCPNVLCAKCEKVNYSPVTIGGITLNKCDECKWFPKYHRTPSPPGIPVRRLIMAYKMFVPCLSCGVMCGSYDLEGFSINYCRACDRLRELGWNEPPTRANVAPRKIKFADTVQIADIECGRRFLILRTTTNNLILWGTIGSSYYKCYLPNPDNITIKAISCGGDHLAVVSSCGYLYTCGDGGKGQLGYDIRKFETDPLSCEITLRKVIMKGRVKKVSCRNTGTVCLMVNGSIMCFGSHIRRISRYRWSLTSSNAHSVTTPTKISGKFMDVDCSPLTNVYCAKTEPLFFLWGGGASRRERLRITAAHCSEVLADRPFTYTAPVKDLASQAQYIPFCSVYAELYGNALYSDMTLKLSDGDFPVHRSVLHVNSVYFKQLLSVLKVTPSTLDVSSYNALAYKSLLKYFYGVEQDEISMNDLFDLYELACIYEESDIVDHIIHRFKVSYINKDHVLQVHEKAKSGDFEELIHECDHYIDSSECNQLVLKDGRNSLTDLPEHHMDTEE